ncbi:sensor histidine kinase [Pyruvatibacter mobilis]|uniref:sensor histidine kinase n=1 Tax=Pyruvatibacter mobilis TaxID=1712261 RepID=UPI003BAC3299
MAQNGDEEKRDDFATPGARAYADAALALAIGILGFIVSAFLNLEHRWHEFVGHKDVGMHLEELPIAMFVAGLGFAWFAWRRWIESEAAARESRRANKELQSQLQRNRQMITELQEARCRAEDLDRAKTRFLAHMSHELRTPLNAIIGFSELMQLETYGPLGDRHYDDYTASIHQSGQHLLELINDLLDLTRIESGDLTPHYTEEVMGDIGQAACRMLQDRAGAAGVHLIYQPGSAADTDVQIDSRMIRQVLINLIANSIRHTPSGGVVDVTTFEGDHGCAGYVVADTGEGMDAAALRRVQSGFAEVKSALQRDHNGAGIGLPLSRAIMEAHGGSLDIASRPGEGTRVTVTLPPERVITASAAAFMT